METIPANNQAVLVGGIIFLLIGLFHMLREVVLTRSTVTGMAEVVAKRYEDIHDEGVRRTYLLTCVVVEAGKRLTAEKEIKVNKRTWNNAQIGGQIEVRYPPNLYQKMQPAPSARANSPYFYLVAGSVMIVLSILHIVPGSYG